MNKLKIDRYFQDHTFVKYFFRENIIHSEVSFLNVVKNDIEYKFSIERLTIRTFSGNDYKSNNDRKIFNNSSYRIAFYLDGESKIYIDGVLKEVNPSYLFIQTPGNQISVPPKVYSNCTVLEFYFDLTDKNKTPLLIDFSEYLNRVFGTNIGEINEITKINDTTKNQLQNMFEALYVKLLDYDITGNGQKCYVDIFNILNRISSIFIEDKIPSESLGMVSVIRALKHNYKKDFTIDELAALASLSKHYFQNLFKKNYGVTPINYLNSIRIKHAKFMLKNYTYSCSEISNNVGFKNAFYFSKVFKKYTGCSPSAYRAEKSILK